MLQDFNLNAYNTLIDRIGNVDSLIYSHLPSEDLTWYFTNTIMNHYLFMTAFVRSKFSVLN